jgi:hypothetical protein
MIIIISQEKGKEADGLKVTIHVTKFSCPPWMRKTIRRKSAVKFAA